MRVFRHDSQGRYSFRCLIEIYLKKHIASAWVDPVTGKIIKGPRFCKMRPWYFEYHCFGSYALVVVTGVVTVAAICSVGDLIVIMN